jgi:hypothetical protein
MLDFSIKLRPFGKTYWIISPETHRIHAILTSLTAELQFRCRTILMGEALIDHALKRGWIIIELIREVGYGYQKGYYNAVVQVAGGFDHNSIMVNRCVGLLKLLEHNVQKDARLPITLEIYHYHIKGRDLKEKRIIEKSSVSASAFAHLLISGHFNF